MNGLIQATPGRIAPFGATVDHTGTNFVLFSRHATRVWLSLFTHPDDATPKHTIELDPTTHRTEDVWHVHLTGVGHGQLYMYQIDGPHAPAEGHRFNRHKPLLDPYAKAIVNGSAWDFAPAQGYDDSEEEQSLSTVTDFANTPKCMVYGDDGFDWQGDQRLQRPLNETIIYETHISSLTRHPSAQVKQPGTFGGVIEMIPYFQRLGITAVEFLPIQQFNTLEFERYNPTSSERLSNYWGYNPLNFFAPHAEYSHYPEPGGAIIAFKEMVRALHQAGIEVILDMVFNHTAEQNQNGPIFSMQGIDNSIYYMLQEDRQHYHDFTGVQNSLNANHPVVQQLILDCLRYWVHELHVDGFRLSLGATLCRNQQGKLLDTPPLIERIAEDPYLRSIKLIAEPWDIADYLVGKFPQGERWMEWNDKYRDEVRQFWRGDPNLTSKLATRLAGSSDLYADRSPQHSINFITVHDGFTLNDLVSYNKKHNEANGLDNRDGRDENYSYNYEAEGPTDDPTVERTRKRQIKNFLATLLLSQGTPLLHGGDEFRRTKQGNNNTYCQNNELSWYDWSLLETHAEIFRFTQQLIRLRKEHPIFRRLSFFTGEDKSGNQLPDVRWYSPLLDDPDWNNRTLMCILSGAKQNLQTTQNDVNVVMMFNADFETREFRLIPPPNSIEHWHTVINTGQPSPRDIYAPGNEVPIDWMSPYHLTARSMAVLISRLKRHSYGD